MSEARHYGRGVLDRAINQRALVTGEGAIDLVDGVAYPQSKIGRDLVVARARGVQAPGGRPDHLGEPALDIHMDVLERALEREGPAFDL